MGFGLRRSGAGCGVTAERWRRVVVLVVARRPLPTAARAAAAARHGGGGRGRSPAQPSHECAAALTATSNALHHYFVYQIHRDKFTISIRNSLSIRITQNRPRAHVYRTAENILY